MKFIDKHHLLILFSIPVISLALHFHVFKLDLIGYHVWRQTETQTVINNFYREDFNILNPRINEHPETNRLHRMEFPVMQWVYALFYKLFGPHIVITRVLTFIMGLFSVFGMFYLCKRVFKNNAIATICAWCFNFSPVFYYYTINPLPDNLALCSGIWCLGFFYAYLNTGKTKYVVWSALFLCLATMAKLPFILYGTFIFAFVLVSLKRKTYTPGQLAKPVLIYAAGIIPALAWYLYVIPGWVIGAVYGVFNQKLNHPDLQYVLERTIISILPELLINYASLLFFLCSFYFLFKCKIYKKQYFFPFLFLGITLIVYFLYEMNIIDVVHDYYLFPFLPLIFLLVAYGAFRLLTSESKPLKIVSMICLAILPITAFLRADPRWDIYHPEFNPTYYKYKDELRNLTPKDATCVIGYDESHYILLYYIDRKGWAFDKSWFDEKLLENFISEGADYIFLDENIDSLPGIKAHLGEKIFDKETVRVYKLKK